LDCVSGPSRARRGDDVIQARALLRARQPRLYGQRRPVLRHRAQPIQTLDIQNQTAARIDVMPPDAVGFESVTLDQQLLVPRSTAAADIYDVNDIQTTVYGLRGSDGAASRLFTMPGYLGNAVRLR
jgi:hypothetical protein